MKKSIAILLTTIMISSAFLAGCGKSAAPAGNAKTEASDAGDTGSSEAASGGNSVDVQVGPSPETIDPALNSAVDGANMIIHAFEGLLKFDKDNNLSLIHI